MVKVPKVKRIMGGTTGRKPHPAYGAVVSCSTDDGDCIAFAVTDAPTLDEALRVIVPKIDRLEGRWFIDAISTPQTIYQDLIGASPGGARWHYRERQALALIGRTDLLREPSVLEERAELRRKVPGAHWRTTVQRFRRRR